MSRSPRHVVFGTGAIGLATLEALRRRGEQVRLVNRSGTAPVPDDVEVLGGDASDPAFATAAAQGAQVLYQTLNPPYHQWVELFPALPAGVLAAAEATGARPAVWAPVHVDALHADQPGPGGFVGGKHAGLEGGEQLDPLVVGRVEGLVEDLGALGGGRGERRVAGVAAEDLDVVGDRGGAGAVDQPHLLATAAEGLQGGQADGAGPEDHMPWTPTHDGSARAAPSPIVVVLMLVFPSGAQVLASRPAGSWSDMPVGQATSLALMASSLPICDRLAPADHARADRGDAWSCRCQPPAVLGGYRANALVGAGCKGGGAAGLVAARSRSSSTPDRAMNVIAP